MSHAIALAQLEGAMITLQKYSTSLAEQTENEEKSNIPEEPTEVEVEEEDPGPTHIGSEELEKRSSTYRNSQKQKKK